MFERKNRNETVWEKWGKNGTIKKLEEERNSDV